MSALEIEPKGPLHSGDWLTVRLRGEVPASAGPDNRLGVRVRSLQTAQIVFALDLTAREPSLSEPGTFDATVELQLNTGKGYFSHRNADLEHSRTARAGSRPAGGDLREHGDGFHGGTNLHPRVHVEARPASATARVVVGLIGERC